MADPLHGITLKQIINDLVEHFTWDELASRIRVRCFTHDPSVGSTLKFMRRTPWAREKVERLWLQTFARNKS